MLLTVPRRAGGARITMDGGMQLTAGRGRTGFSPQSLSGLQLWLAADTSPKWQDSARTIPSENDSAPIGAWDDLSGSGNHAVQATAGKRPLFRTAMQNGRPVLRFDGVDDVLRTASVVTTSVTNLTIMAAITLPDASRHGAILNNGFTGGGYAIGVGSTQMDLTGNKFLGLWNAVRWIDPAITIGTGGHVLALTMSGATTSTFFLDAAAGVVDVSAAAIGPPLGATEIGGGQSSSVRYFNADMCEVLLYTRALTDPERLTVAHYLGAKWGIAA